MPYVVNLKVLLIIITLLALLKIEKDIQVK